MLDRFEEAARLKNLLGRREAIVDREKDTRTVNHGIVERMEIDQDIRNAAPWLLEVAGCFQKGDATLLRKLHYLLDTYHPDNDEDMELIERLLEAAKIMERK